VDHVKSLARVYHCQFRGYKTYEGRWLDKAVVMDEVYGVREVVGIGYAINVTSGAGDRCANRQKSSMLAPRCAHIPPIDLIKCARYN